MQNISSIDQNSKLGCEQTKKWLKTDLNLAVICSKTQGASRILLALLGYWKETYTSKQHNVQY